MCHYKFESYNCYHQTAHYCCQQEQSKHNWAVSSVATESLVKKMKQTDLSTHSYKGIDMPFSPTEAAAIQAQTLQATISGNAHFCFFEDIEVLKLIWMLRTAAPDIMPLAKVVGGPLLNETAKSIETKISKILKKKDVGLSYVYQIKYNSEGH